MPWPRFRRLLLAWALGLALAPGCAEKGPPPVLVPPRLDLARYPTLGIVEFDATGGSGLGALATREFLAAAAPGLPVQSIEEARAHGRDGDWRPPSLESGDPALLQYTSGSTGAPRGVLLTHGNLLHNQRFIAERLEQSRETVGVSWLPMFHDMGLIGKVIQPLYLGCQCILMSPEAFLQKPRRWLAAITRYRATARGPARVYYNIWVLSLDDDGRCSDFTEYYMKEPTEETA